jgi:hypothetical protein
MTKIFFSTKSLKIINGILMLIVMFSFSLVPYTTLHAQEQSAAVVNTNPAPAERPGATVNTKEKTFTLSNPLKGVDSVGDLVNKFVEIFSYLVIIAGVIMIVVTGFNMILARGNPDKITENAKRLGAILIGIGIVIGARIMVMIIINTLEASGAVKEGTVQTIQKAVDGK